MEAALTLSDIVRISAVHNHFRKDTHPQRLLLRPQVPANIDSSGVRLQENIQSHEARRTDLKRHREYRVENRFAATPSFPHVVELQKR